MRIFTLKLEQPVTSLKGAQVRDTDVTSQFTETHERCM